MHSPIIVHVNQRLPKWKIQCPLCGEWKVSPASDKLFNHGAWGGVFDEARRCPVGSLLIWLNSNQWEEKEGSLFIEN